jgi:transposase-like protein
MTKQKYSKEVRERAVRMVREHQCDHPSEWATIQSVAAKLGCTPQTLHNWLRKAQVETG